MRTEEKNLSDWSLVTLWAKLWKYKKKYQTIFVIWPIWNNETRNERIAS